MTVLYLHGFASGPDSTKGRFLRGKFGELGVEVETPDLEAGDFAGLTLTRQLDVIDRCVRARPRDVLIGSSLGGYLAALYAARHPGRFRLVLLAPGFGFARRWPERLGTQAVRLWRERGWMEVYHYGLKRTCRIGYQLLEDGRQYEDYPEVRDATLILHGVRDEVAPLAWSEEFVSGKPQARLLPLDSDHQLLDVLDRVWREIRAFLSR
jgi:hypothetical protein